VSDSGGLAAWPLRSPWVTWGAGLALLLALATVSLLVGPGGGLTGLADADPQTAALIVREIRLPRTLLAALAGATLGLSGAALQGLLRNPLAEPGLIGASSSAALGASWCSISVSPRRSRSRCRSAAWSGHWPR
jgi:iron complex transport system permease protein